MSFKIDGNDFVLNNKKIFLISGEIHYFRIKRELWGRHLEAAREAGLMAVSTYVPWAWHEDVEGVFDFDGSSCPERDLKGWIGMCQEHGLNCILKPGPFILAEFRGAGLPGWFLSRYNEEARMRNSKGEIVPGDGVSLFNRNYLEKVTLWYDQVMPFIAQHEKSSGGPVIMMQVCNEAGLFSWLAHQADYGNTVRERFIEHLFQKFKKIEVLNALWGTGYKDFPSVELPPDGKAPYASKEDRGRDHEWHRFWRRYYGDYLRMLTEMARERGVTVPLFHNFPGWIYGHGYEFPVNMTMYADLFGDKSEIVFGVDHIPEFVSHRNMHDDRIINDISRAMQGDKPLFAAEFQCGSREYQVVTNPRETELFCKASIANGLTGWNYYMFSQGKNPHRKGYSGDTFYWFNPLTSEGERTGAYPPVKRMNRLVKALENIIVTAVRKAEVCVLFYSPYYATELERPEEGGSGLRFNASSIRRPAFFDGLLKALQVMNIDYDMMDLSHADPDSLKRYRQVWVFCTDEMDAEEQRGIAGYIRSGGNCVIFPYLPDREMSQKPCRIIRDAMNIDPAGAESIDSPLIDIFNMKDIKCSNPQIVYTGESLKGDKIIARTLNGNPCGFSKIIGNGSVTHLGTWIGFDTESHKLVYEEILKRSGAVLRQTSSDNGFITVRERFTDDGSALLFIGNYYNEEQKGKVSYTHPSTGEIVSIPYIQDEIMWPPLYGVLTPVCLPVSDGIKILHATSDILDVSDADDHALVTLYGDRDLAGEIVFEGADIGRMNSATINGEIIQMYHKENRVALKYDHAKGDEIILRIFKTRENITLSGFLGKWRRVRDSIISALRA